VKRTITNAIIIIVYTTPTQAQPNKFEINAGINYGVNFSQITSVLNDGAYMGYNPTEDHQIQESYTGDYQIGIGYTLNNRDIVSVVYRRFNTAQEIKGAYASGTATLKISNPYNSFGLYYKKYWSNRRSGFFSRHGINILFDNSTDKTSFTRQSKDGSTAYDYDRLINYKSFTTVNFIFSNAVGFSQYLSPHFSIEYYMDYNLGVRNLSTNSVVFKSKHYASDIWSYSGSATGMNKGDKIGIGIQLNYKF
jgi:hypothetical protein